MVPPVGEMPNQGETRKFTELRQVNGLPPVLVMVTVWGGRLLCPWVAAKLIFNGDALISGAPGGDGAWTVSCTPTVCVFNAVANEIVALYTPGARPVVFTPIVITEPAAPFN